ncbi:DUF3558 domain-containing protein [Streptomyces sp. NPDC005805]|uniref:DUF3558 domain-containing protein n=1 Tax=Streptomyces sp. NPDC005805 TaxID=3157068 RepID=UPI0033DC5C28
MLRKAYVQGTAALLAAVVAAGAAGCTGSGGGAGSTTDSKAADGAAPAAQPGRYRTLLEPCGAVDRSVLRDMLPGVATLSEEQRRQVLQGVAAATYDTDRRAACSWKGSSPGAAHQLRVDFERVVSYDPAVSDDARAQEVYIRKQSSASVPIAPPDEEGEDGGDGGEGEEEPEPSGSPSGATEPGSTPAVGTQAGETDAAAETGAAGSSGPPQEPGADPDAPGQPGGPGSGTSPDPSQDPESQGLEPRVLGGLGDAAFLDDVLGGAASAVQRRTVSVVFRTSNVIVSIVYTQQPVTPAVVPDSKELQEKTESLARRLVEMFDR